MKVRWLILAGAGVSLAAAFSATPGLAQSYGHTPQVSTPAESAETQQLNQQGVSGTTQPPSTLNGEPASVQTEQPDPAQQQYDDKQQQYQAQQQRYQQQREQYRAARGQYLRDIRRYDLARYEWTDYPRVYVYRYEAPQLRRLYLIADPTHQLARVPIEGPSGRFIGKVRNVETASDGRPLRIEVALNRAVSVWAPPDRFRYDPEQRVLFTDLTRDDLWDMPGATVESSVIYRP
ncbi:MAG TPA: hypothetical protein VGG69_02875 [Rhizomicrobium sp.]